MTDNLNIHNHTSVPKYQQIKEAVYNAIENKELVVGSHLPSINELSKSNSIARGTVAKAYEELREQGIVIAKHGKGYFISSVEFKKKLRIFLLFDTLNHYKQILYNSFTAAFNENVQVQIFFHHYNLKLFEKLIQDNLRNFHYYVIMPHFNEDVRDILKLIPQEKLMIIDKEVEGLKDVPAVFQNFESDIYKCLKEGKDLINKYKTLNLILSQNNFQFIPEGTILGFRRFCNDFKISNAIIENINLELVKPGMAFLVFSDMDLINIIKKAQELNLKTGKDIGIISYDDTPMKEVLEKGITVISTDFQEMGLQAAKFIKEKIYKRVENPCSLILRKSL
ncbi:GntR family transcriptional regulator [soil metagenome]